MMDNLNSLYNIHADLEVPDFLYAYAGLTRTPDIIPVMFKMTHAATNANRDHIPSDEMLKALSTIEHKALTWEHKKEKIIGTLVRGYLITLDEFSDIVSVTSGNGSVFSNKEILSELKDLLKIKNGEKTFILAIGVLWSHRNQSEIQEVVDRFNNGELKWSMEVFAQTVECSDCLQVFSGKLNKYCEHINNRNRIINSTCSRILKDVFFSGAGVVMKPADINGLNIALGSKEGEDVEMETAFKVFETEEEFNSFKSELVSELNKEIASLKEANASLNSKLEEFDSRANALSSEKGKIESDFSDLQLKMDIVNSEVASLKSTLAAKEAELTVSSDLLNAANEVIASKVANERFGLLIEAGLTVSEDGKSKWLDKLVVASEDEFGMLLDSLKSTVQAVASKSSATPSIPFNYTMASSTETPVEDDVDGNEDVLDKIFGISPKRVQSNGR